MWGENGQDAGLESALTPLPLIPELGDTEALESGRVNACSYYKRDLPYSWETFMENVLVSLSVVRANFCASPRVTVCDLVFNSPALFFGFPTRHR